MVEPHFLPFGLHGAFGCSRPGPGHGGTRRTIPESLPLDALTPILQRGLLRNPGSAADLSICHRPCQPPPWLLATTDAAGIPALHFFSSTLFNRSTLPRCGPGHGSASESSGVSRIHSPPDASLESSSNVQGYPAIPAFIVGAAFRELYTRQ
jgi:hypothetical protein